MPMASRACCFLPVSWLCALFLFALPFLPLFSVVGFHAVVAGHDDTKIGDWSFDDSAAQDNSFQGNPLSAVPRAGPGVDGHSGVFGGVNARFLATHIEAYNAPDITTTVRFFLTEKVSDSFQTLLHKGNADKFAYSVDLWPESQQIRVRVGDKIKNSQSTVAVNRWTSIALVLSANKAVLYVNGLRDISFGFTDRTLAVQPPSPWVTSLDHVYIGSHPAPGTAGVNAYIDSVVMYNVQKSEAFIRALAAFADRGVASGSDFVWLGCKECTRADAAQRCANAPRAFLVEPKKGGAPQYQAGDHRGTGHICTESELNGGAMQVARTMGWFDASSTTSKVYAYENVEKDASTPDVLGLGVCCHDDQ